MSYTDTVNSYSHKDILKNLKCSYCKEPAHHWFGSTSVTLCGNSECDRKARSEYERLRREIEAEREWE